MLDHRVGPSGIACRGRLAAPGVEAARGYPGDETCQPRRGFECRCGPLDVLSSTLEPTKRAGVTGGTGNRSIGDRCGASRLRCSLPGEDQFPRRPARRRNEWLSHQIRNAQRRRDRRPVDRVNSTMASRQSLAVVGFSGLVWREWPVMKPHPAYCRVGIFKCPPWHQRPQGASQQRLADRGTRSSDECNHGMSPVSGTGPSRRPGEMDNQRVWREQLRTGEVLGVFLAWLIRELARSRWPARAR